ncbi:MAG: adenylate/guanylate cyclase domain-containing protein, partial [Spirochaetota bacterium]
TKTNKAQKGVLHLGNHNFAKVPIINLRGQWEFYWQHFCFTRMNCQNLPNKQYIAMPGYWNSFVYNNKAVGGKGFASYHLQVRLQQLPKQPVLKMSNVGTAYELWINGELRGKSGKVATEEAEGYPGQNPQLYILHKKDFKTSENTSNEMTLDIFVHVSNYHDQNGGIWREIWFGEYESLAKKQFHKAVIDFLLIGGIFSIGIYYISLHILWRKDPSALWFGLYCLLTSLRILFVGENYLRTSFPEASLFFTFCEYTVLVLLPTSFLKFLSSIYPAEFSSKSQKFYIYSSLLFLVPIFILPTYYYTFILNPFHIYLFLGSIYITYTIPLTIQNKREGAKLFLVGWLAIFLCLANDILYARSILTSMRVLPFGLMFFFTVQALLLALRLSRAFRAVKEISENLESKIQERTIELENSKQETEKQKNFIQDINSLIRKLNEHKDLQIILEIIMQYIKDKYGFSYYSLFSIDKTRNILINHISSYPTHVTEEQKIYMKNVTYSLKKKSGESLHAKAFRQKLPLHIYDIAEAKQSQQGKDILPILQNKSLLILPIFLENNLIGSLDVYSLEKQELNEEALLKLSILSKQLAGILNGSLLYQELAEEKEFSNLARVDAEIAKQEIEFLNDFSKVINSAKALEEVFEQAVQRLNDKLHTDMYMLQLIDKEKKEIFTRCLAANVDSNIYKKYSQLQIPLEEAGTIYRTYQRKRTLYLRDNRKQYNELPRSDQNFLKDLNIVSTFQIPLIVNGEVIGIMHINKKGGMHLLSRQEIRFAESLCEQLAIAVNHSFLYETSNAERKKSDKLLRNILPEDIAQELKETGSTQPVHFDNVSVLFTDFKGFTQIAEKLSPAELIAELDNCFVHFDRIIEKYKLEKLKTIGDSYMCAGGIPRTNQTHAIDTVLAALEIHTFMETRKKEKQKSKQEYWEIRIGIHSGSLVAGVIGEKKFAYDVWGDTVNTASRMESSGTPGRVNISGSTYELVKDFFECEYRGKIDAKNKGEVDMYYVNSLKISLSHLLNRKEPNKKFWESYNKLK